MSRNYYYPQLSCFFKLCERKNNNITKYFMNSIISNIYLRNIFDFKIICMMQITQWLPSCYGLTLTNKSPLHYLIIAHLLNSIFIWIHIIMILHFIHVSAIHQLSSLLSTPKWPREKLCRMHKYKKIIQMIDFV